MDREYGRGLYNPVIVSVDGEIGADLLEQTVNVIEEGWFWHRTERGGGKGVRGSRRVGEGRDAGRGYEGHNG